jgi:hypothetical protein
MSGPTDVVIAGTKPFALALFAPVTERAGSRPRIAPEPATALTLCAQSSGLLVVEYEPRWLPALTQLRLERPALRMVAALARGQEGAALSLGPLSIDAVPWDGQAASVMAAIERALVVGAAEPTATEGHAPIEPAPMAFATSAASLAQSSPVLSRSNPSLGQSSPTLSRSNPTLGQSSPALARSNPTLGQSASPLPAGPPDVAAISTLPPSPLPSPVNAGVTWPATGPSAAEAELALRALLAGKVDTSPLRAVTEQTAAGLSSLERDVFSGGTVPVDADLVRHAAVLRLRTAAALATRPPAGTPIDSEAVAELLSEIDGVLHQVKALVDVATAEVRPSLEAIRNALVKEAVDFSEACHEIGTAELPLAPAPVHQTGRAAAARVLSDHSGLDAEDRPEEKRKRTRPLVTLLVILALAGLFHGWSIYTAPVKQAPATYEGAPAGTMAIQSGGSYFLKALPGNVVSPADLEAYRQREARRGNKVLEIGPGTWIIEPATAGEGTKP